MGKEIDLRNSINSKLKARGFHLQLKNIYFKGNDFGFDFVEPLDPWINEWPTVDSMVTAMIKEWMARQD